MEGGLHGDFRLQRNEGGFGASALHNVAEWWHCGYPLPAWK
jgi:hypothetical protein